MDELNGEKQHNERQEGRDPGVIQAVQDLGAQHSPGAPMTTDGAGGAVRVRRTHTPPPREGTLPRSELVIPCSEPPVAS